MPQQSRMIFFHLEDNRIAQRILQNTFREMADFISARTFEEAQESLRTLPDVSCFFIDDLLPGKSGLTFVRKIRFIEKYDMVPVFLLTSTVTPDIAFKAIRIGANDVVSKMESPETMRNTVTQHLQRSQCKYIPRTYYEVECVAFAAAKKYFQYCPDLERTVCADSPEEAADRMRTVLDDMIHKRNMRDFYVMGIDSCIHRIGMKQDSGL